MELNEIFRVIFFILCGVSFLGIAVFFVFLLKESILNKIVCSVFITSSIMLASFMFSIIFINPENTVETAEAIYKYNLEDNKYIELSEEQHSNLQMYSKNEEYKVIHFANDKTSTEIKSDSYKKIQPKSSEE